MNSVKLRQILKATTDLLRSFPENQEIHCLDIFRFFDNIYKIIICNYETCERLQINLFRRHNKKFALSLATAIVEYLPGINAGLRKIGFILGEHGPDFNLHELCRIRSGLQFLFTEFDNLPVYRGKLSKPPCTRRASDYYALHEYLHDDDTLTGRHIERFDTHLREACHHNKLSIVDIHPQIPPAHWWWSEATKCKCINTMFPTISIATEFEHIEDKYDQQHVLTFEEL
jgi:hypothetical protein